MTHRQQSVSGESYRAVRKMDNIYKKDFPIFEREKGLVYLDNSATTQKPQSVLDAAQRYYSESNANPLRGLYGLSVRATDVYENAREAARAFINAKSTREIVFTRGATEGLNLLAYSLGRLVLGEGDEVLIGVSEHHSNILPWQVICKERGAKLKYLEPDKNGRYTESALTEALSERTKIFSLAQVSNVFGRRNDIKAFGDICRKNGTLIICDGAQSVPHMKTDVRELGVDALVFSGHKMLAPMGIGVLYAKEELLEKMPPYQTGGEMIEYVTREGATFAELPHKFEAGTVNVGGAAGLHAAIDYINSKGFDKLIERERELTAFAFEKMKNTPYVNIIGSDKAQDHDGIIAFTVEGVHPHDIAAVFDSQNIAIRAGHHCAQPLHQFLGVPSSARLSLAFYNDEEDIERFTKTLATVRRLMGYDK